MLQAHTGMMIVTVLFGQISNSNSQCNGQISLKTKRFYQNLKIQL